MINWQLIIQYKNKHGYTWQELSELAGLARNTIYYWYSKRVDSPRVSYLSKVAILIGAKLDDIWIAEAE